MWGAYAWERNRGRRFKPALFLSALPAWLVLPGKKKKKKASYAAAVQALLEDGPLQGTTVEVEAVEGRPPKTVDVPDDKGGVCRYCLAEWTQEGMTAAYTFLYAV